MISNRYQLEDLLGRGRMAEVYRALDLRLGRPVAVKKLRTDLANDPTLQARIRREAQSAAGLNHPTIVAVYDIGEETDPTTGGSIVYIVMELVEGKTLRDVLRDRGTLLPERALEITAGVLDALSYSHNAGILHRGIQPASVMLTPNGQVKVMDFGIARALGDSSATMMGSAQYLSPEQARGETVDARSDIYSAGCLLYELLVGRPPFIGDSPISVAYQHVREAPPPPSRLSPEISPDIDAITLRALAKDPDDRYQSAQDFKNDITRWLAWQYPARWRDGTQTRHEPSESVYMPPPASLRRSETPAPVVDENVQFTVYRPNAVRPEVWYPLLAFAHLAERRAGAPPGEPDPLEQVRARAAQAGVEAYGGPRVDARGGVPREGQLTFVPFMDGVDFNPRSQTFEWQEDVHQQDFRLKARSSTEGRMLRGQLTVYLGAFILADIALTIRVDVAAAPPAARNVRPQTLFGFSSGAEPGLTPATAVPYQKVFPSYSHKDLPIVHQAEAFGKALGHVYLRDRLALRSGEQWQERLLELIDEADIFQLFWSSNSMRSEYVRREWEHALALQRPGFIRPTYWEVPMPQSADPPLPPDTLIKFHFHGFFEESDGDLDPSWPTASASAAPTALDEPPPSMPRLPVASETSARSNPWVGYAVFLILGVLAAVLTVLVLRR